MPTETVHEVRRILESEMLHVNVTPAETALTIYKGDFATLRMYLASKKLDGLSDLTLDRYREQLTRFVHAIPKPPSEIQTMEIRAYLAAYQASGVMMSSVSTMQSCLKSYFSWLEAEDIIAKSPMRKLKAIKVPKRTPKFMTAKQMELLRLACRDNRDRAILETYYSTGCRVSELQKANRAAINMADGSLSVIGKGNKERVVYINERAMVHLKKFLDEAPCDDGSLFPRERARYARMSVRAIQNVFARLGQVAGIERRVHPHLMRHTIATTLLRNGTDIAKIQRLLGHSNPATTQVYAITDDAAVHDAHKRCS